MVKLKVVVVVEEIKTKKKIALWKQSTSVNNVLLKVIFVIFKIIFIILFTVLLKLTLIIFI